MTAPKPRRRRDPRRRPSAAALGAAANGDWASHAACRNQPDYTSQDPDSVTYTCSRCSVAADCAQLGKLELARALTDRADRGEDRVYAGHQLRDLLLLARCPACAGTGWGPIDTIPGWARAQAEAIRADELRRHEAGLDADLAYQAFAGEEALR